MSAFGEDLIQSLSEALAHAEGEGPANVHAQVAPREVRKHAKLTQAHHGSREPNATTVEAMKEMDEGKGRRFDTAKELFRDLDMADHGQKRGLVGSSFEDYLATQGALEETNVVAVKRVLAWQLRRVMKARKMSKSAMAKTMRTSRSQLDRILDPENDRIRLDTLAAAAKAVGLNLKIELVG